MRHGVIRRTLQGWVEMQVKGQSLSFCVFGHVARRGSMGPLWKGKPFPEKCLDTMTKGDFSGWGFIFDCFSDLGLTVRYF